MSRPKSRGNGQGTAYRRGKTWQARIVIGWKITGDPPHTVPIWRTKDGFKTKKEALSYCEVLKHETERPKDAPLLEVYWNAYHDGKMQSLSDSKQTAYNIAWNKLKSIHHKRINTLTVAELQQIINEKAPTYYPARDCKSLLLHLFKLAGAEGWVSKALPEYLILPKLNETEREPFTEEEQAALWKAYENGYKDAAIPLIMIYTGMMTGEMRRLTVDMIDYENRQIVGVGLKTKVRKENPVYIHTSVVPLLQEASAGKIGRIWACSEDDFYRRYYDALSVAGCRKLTPYSCRHTTATALAITENIAPQTIRKIMRWSTTKMLDRYAHPDDSDALAAIDTL